MKAKLINDGPQKPTYWCWTRAMRRLAALRALPARTVLRPPSSPASARAVMQCSGSSTGRRKATERFPSPSKSRSFLSLATSPLGLNGKPALHPHVVVSRADGTAMGGHLLEAHVRPTLEVVLTESPRHLHKRKDAESGLALIAVEE